MKTASTGLGEKEIVTILYHAIYVFLFSFMTRMLIFDFYTDTDGC